MTIAFSLFGVTVAFSIFGPERDNSEEPDFSEFEGRLDDAFAEEWANYLNRNPWEGK